MNRIAQIETLRALAMIGVVVRHVLTYHWEVVPMDGWVGFVVVAGFTLSWSAVPLFVGLSLFSMLERYPGRMSASAYWQMLARRASALLPAYFFWSVVSLVLFRRDVLDSMGQVFSALLDGSADGHFYFVPLMFQVYCFWPVFAALSRRMKDSPKAQVLGLLVSFACWYAAWVASSAGLLSPGFFSLLPLWSLYVGLALVAAPSVARLFVARLRPSWLFVVASLAVVASGTLSISNFYEVAGPGFGAWPRTAAAIPFQPKVVLFHAAVAAWAVVAFARSGPAPAFLAGVAENSYGIFVCHLVVLRCFVMPLLGRPSADLYDSPLWVLHLLVSTVVCLGVSYALVRGLSASSLTAWSVQHRR